MKQWIRTSAALLAGASLMGGAAFADTAKSPHAGSVKKDHIVRKWGKIYLVSYDGQGYEHWNYKGMDKRKPSHIVHKWGKIYEVSYDDNGYEHWNYKGMETPKATKEPVAKK